jgi:hypothetical protein
VASATIFGPLFFPGNDLLASTMLAFSTFRAEKRPLLVFVVGVALGAIPSGHELHPQRRAQVLVDRLGGTFEIALHQGVENCRMLFEHVLLAVR